jgi:endonuclease IV
MAIDNSEQIAALRAAVATGSKRVVFHSGGTRREVEYPSLKEMLDAIDRLEAQQSPRSRVTLGAFRMGRT